MVYGTTGAFSKEETYDKNGAIDDYTEAIRLKSADESDGSWMDLENTFDSRADLYIKLGAYQKAIDDYSQVIGHRLHVGIMMINLERFRALYPEYRSVDDARLIDKLHRLYYPHYADDAFRKEMYRPTNDASNDLLAATYLKRADAYLAVKNFSDAVADYRRSALVYDESKGDYDRWRTPPGVSGLAFDIQTLHAAGPNSYSAWVKSADSDGTLDDNGPAEYHVDCANRKIASGSSSNWIEPVPSSREEHILNFFCQ